MSAISHDDADKKKLAFLKSVKALGGKSAKSKMKILQSGSSGEKEKPNNNEAGLSESSIPGLESRIEEWREKDSAMATQNFKRGSIQQEAALSCATPVSKEVTKVHILKDKFEPSKVVVPAGSTVEWSIELDRSNLELNSRSLYHGKARMYVISFDTLPDESDPLRSPDDKFSVTFTEPGTFSYRCPIYTWMQGSVVVVGNSKKKQRRSLFEEQSIDSLIKSVKPGRPFEYIEQLSEDEESKHPSDQNLDQRLIEVLDNEGDLRVKSKGAYKTPFISNEYFQELFDRKGMQFHDADLSSEGLDEIKESCAENSDAEEEAFMS